MMIAAFLAAILVMPSPVGTPVFHDELSCPGNHMIAVDAYDTNGNLEDLYELIIYSYNGISLIAIVFDEGQQGKANAIYIRELNGNVAKVGTNDVRLKQPLCSFIPSLGKLEGTSNTAAFLRRDQAGAGTWGWSPTAARRR